MQQLFSLYFFLYRKSLLFSIDGGKEHDVYWFMSESERRVIYFSLLYARCGDYFKNGFQPQPLAWGEISGSKNHIDAVP